MERHPHSFGPPRLPTPGYTTPPLDPAAMPLKSSVALRPLELYDGESLARDLLARKSLRISVPESVARFLPRKDLDWSREIEVPPQPGAPASAAEREQQLRNMNDLEGRFQGLRLLTHAMGGRIWYTMLGGSRYAARIDWGGVRAA